MSILENRRPWKVVALVCICLPFGACNVKDQLLEPQNPGLVDPSAVASPTAALALRVGAIGRYKQVQAGESIWQMGGTLADEYKNADFEAGRINADMRRTDPAVSWNYNGVTQARGFVRDAIKAMKEFNPDRASNSCHSGTKRPLLAVVNYGTTMAWPSNSRRNASFLLEPSSPASVR